MLPTQVTKKLAETSTLRKYSDIKLLRWTEKESVCDLLHKEGLVLVVKKRC